MQAQTFYTILGIAVIVGAILVALVAAQEEEKEKSPSEILQEKIDYLKHATQKNPCYLTMRFTVEIPSRMLGIEAALVALAHHHNVNVGYTVERAAGGKIARFRLEGHSQAMTLFLTAAKTVLEPLLEN